MDGLTVTDASYYSFTIELKFLFEKLLPLYVPKAHQKSGTKVQLKTDGTPVTDLDTYTMEQLRSFIGTWFPEDGTIGEEDKKSPAEMQKIMTDRERHWWTIDGLDGTWHFIRGTNSYGAMISCRRGDSILYAAIFRPIDWREYGNGFFFAERTCGAWEWCTYCRTFHQLQAAPAGTYDEIKNPRGLERTTVLLEGSSKKFFEEPIASLGLKLTTRASLSSCIAATTVARGGASGLVTRGNKPWDNWPAMLMIQEAGGIVTNYHGVPATPENCEDIVAAANEEAHLEILKALNP